MKLAQHANALETNAELKSQDFGIGNASVVIEILRNRLYSHPIRTLVQEYMSNGRDATREIKSKQNIVVSVPNHMSPVFKVRDFGPGITPERMANVFVKYGASTKRNTNGQTGGFGIGAKSAWSYTDSFTIVSITNGIKRTYVAHTGVNNQGRLDMISEVKTDEDSGAEIQVAVKPSDLDNFREAIWRACHFWKDDEYPKFKGVTQTDLPKRKQGTIKLEAAKNTFIELIKGDDLPHYLALENNYYGKNMSVIVDGIPYPVSEKITKESKVLTALLEPIKCHTLLHLGNGDVEVGASRESLADSEFTRKSLESFATYMTKALGEYISGEFEKAKSNSEWMQKYNELYLTANVDKYSKRGDYSINSKAIESLKFRDFTILSVGENTGRRGRGGFKRDTVMSIPMEQLKHVFYLEDTDEAIITQNRRIKEYLQTNNWTRAIVLLPTEKTDLIAVQGKDGKPVLDANNNHTMVSKVRLTLKESTKIVLKVAKDFGARDLQTLPYTPPVRVPRASVDRTKEMFTIHDCNEYGKHKNTTTIAEVDAESTTYLYVKYEDFEKYRKEFGEVHLFLASLNYQVCALTEKSIDMVSVSSMFIPYETWKSKFKITKDILNACLANKANNKGAMKILLFAKNKVKDAHVADMLDVYKGIVNNTVVSPPETIMKLAAAQIKEFTQNDAQLTKTLKTSYPLINTLVEVDDYRITQTDTANELVDYINSKI